MEQRQMPSQGTYLVLVILGFILGIIWGALSVSPYSKMKQAIAVGDVDGAWENANKIKKWVLIGVAVNVVVFLGQMAGAR
jgi:hypothetical protein